MPLSPIPVVKILVVDDDSAIRSYLKACLSKKGHFIVEAKDGRESVELFNSEKPDLILMDVVMPVMNGYEAASIIKERCRGNFVPIIFLSALQDDESIAKCVSSGGDTFLSKPLSAALLDAKINSMIRIIAMTRELESYKQSTEEEIELTQYVFDSLTKRMSVNVVPGLNYWSRAAGHFSGDLMIYDKSPSGKLYVMLGDFTGHGFSAAIGAIPV
ncbi:MAG: response regulator, partial [Gammaproteobacteria bacterium]